MARKTKLKSYKTGRSALRFVMLTEWLQRSEAWATMKPGPRALYIELRRRFTGENNGQIFLSMRDAAKALNVTKDTATAYFRDLAERGFITMTQGGHLGPSGIGQAAKWALQEEPLEGKPATKDFMSWRQNQRQKSSVSPTGELGKQNPVQKIRTPRQRN